MNFTHPKARKKIDYLTLTRLRIRILRLNVIAYVNQNGELKGKRINNEYVS